MKDPYTRLGCEALYTNRWLSVERHEILHPQGNPGEHVLIRGAAPSGVLVIDGTHVVFVSQPRFAARCEMLEIVKGGRDEHESALDAAKRELQEELGLKARSWQPLGCAWELPSLMSEPLQLFLARDVVSVAASPEETELLRAVRLNFKEALKLALDGGLDDATTVTALLRAAHFLKGDDSFATLDV